MAYSQYAFLNPFKPFQCSSCDATLKTGVFVRLLRIVSFCAALGSFYFTFPIMHAFIHSRPDSVVRFLLNLLLPYAVIPVQVTVVFVPVAVYAWRYSKLVVVAPPRERGAILPVGAP
jgi:hypothetical protein